MDCQFEDCRRRITSIYQVLSWASIIFNSVITNFGVGVEEAMPEGPRVEDGVLREGTASPSAPTRGFTGAL